MNLLLMNYKHFHMAYNVCVNAGFPKLQSYLFKIGQHIMFHANCFGLHNLTKHIRKVGIMSFFKHVVA
jgi:hypothetical protein